METVTERYIPMRRHNSDGISVKSRKTIKANVKVDTGSKMVSAFSGNNSDSDSSLSAESSDDSRRGRKRSGESQYIYGESKRVRQDSYPMTIDHNDEMAVSQDLFNSQRSPGSSQQSYMDELNSSQPVGLTNTMPGYYNQPASDIVVMYSSQPSTIASSAEDSNHRVNTKGKQAKNNKRAAKGKQPQSSSQDSNEAYEAEVSEREKQKEKNRKYAQDSRERKNKKMTALEQTNKLQRSVIQIYTKVIGILHKRQNPGANITWANYNIPWYNNVDGESETCQTVECLLPIEDKAFFEELGNTSFGRIISKDVPVMCPGDVHLPDSTMTRGSDVVMTSNSGSMMTHRTMSNPAPNLSRMSQTTNCPSSLPVGPDYTQNTLTKLESRDCADGRQNRSGDMLHLFTLTDRVKLEPTETVHRGGFISLQTPSSQMPIVCHDTSDLMSNRQIITNMNNPSSATTPTETISVTTYLDMNSHGKRLPLSGSNFTPKLGSDVAPATVNILPDDPSIPNLSAQNYTVSRGNDFNIAVTKGMVCTDKSENDDFSLPMTVNSQCRSSSESVHQETSDVEDLQFTLDLADSG